MRTHNVIVGENCRSSGTLAKIGLSISNSMHRRLTTFIQGTRNPIVVLIDGSTDKGLYLLTNAYV